MPLSVDKQQQEIIDFVEQTQLFVTGYGLKKEPLQTDYNTLNERVSALFAKVLIWINSLVSKSSADAYLNVITKADKAFQPGQCLHDKIMSSRVEFLNIAWMLDPEIKKSISVGQAHKCIIGMDWMAGSNKTEEQESNIRRNYSCGEDEIENYINALRPMYIPMHKAFYNFRLELFKHQRSFPHVYNGVRNNVKLMEAHNQLMVCIKKLLDKDCEILLDTTKYKN